MLAAAHGELRLTDKELFKRLAYVGRYGHQRVNEMLDLPTSDLRKFVHALSDLLEGESCSSLEDSASG